MGKKYDVVIVGAGISGGLIAYRLAQMYKNNNKSAKNKLSVLILEAGEDRSNRPELVETFLNAPVRTPGSPYKMSPGTNMAPSPDATNDYYDQSEMHDNNQFKSTYERRVGGTTWHWLGNCPRLLPNDFKSKTKYGLGEDWPITYEELEKWYCEAEHEIGVSGDHDELNNSFGAFRTRPFPMNRIWPSYSDLIIANGLKNADDTHKAYNDLPLGLVNTPQARNSAPYNERPVCTGNSTCVPICPIGAKYDATIHIDKAQKNGVDLIPRAIVTRITADNETGKIISVTYKSWDKKEFTITADLFVLAANGIETPKILLMSELPSNNNNVGRYLMDHPQGEGVCVSREPLFPFRGPPTTSGIDKFRDGEFRKDTCAFRLSMGNDGGGRTRSNQDVLNDLITNSFGSTLRNELNQNLTRLFRISFLAEMKPLYDNRVTLSTMPDKTGMGIPPPKIEFKVDNYTMDSFNKISAVMKSIFNTLNPIGDIILPNNLSEHKGAGHIMGTCRMGSDKLNSVVDAECRSHEHDNLFIGGSSVFPTGGTANPTLTIAALSLRIAESIKKQLKLIS